MNSACLQRGILMSWLYLYQHSSYGSFPSAVDLVVFCIMPRTPQPHFSYWDLAFPSVMHYQWGCRHCLGLPSSIPFPLVPFLLTPLLSTTLLYLPPPSPVHNEYSTLYHSSILLSRFPVLITLLIWKSQLMVHAGLCTFGMDCIKPDVKFGYFLFPLSLSFQVQGGLPRTTLWPVCTQDRRYLVWSKYDLCSFFLFSTILVYWFCNFRTNTFYTPLRKSVLYLLTRLIAKGDLLLPNIYSVHLKWLCYNILSA